MKKLKKHFDVLESIESIPVLKSKLNILDEELIVYEDRAIFIVKSKDLKNTYSFIETIKDVNEILMTEYDPRKHKKKLLIIPSIFLGEGSYQYLLGNDYSKFKEKFEIDFKFRIKGIEDFPCLGARISKEYLMKLHDINFTEFEKIVETISNNLDESKMIFKIIPEIFIDIPDLLKIIKERKNQS